MKKALYLPIEIKFRELFPKLLIAFFAAKKDFFSVLGDKEGVDRATDILEKVYILINLYQ